MAPAAGGTTVTAGGREGRALSGACGSAQRQRPQIITAGGRGRAGARVRECDSERGTRRMAKRLPRGGSRQSSSCARGEHLSNCWRFRLGRGGRHVVASRHHAANFFFFKNMFTFLFLAPETGAPPGGLPEVHIYTQHVRRSKSGAVRPATGASDRRAARHVPTGMLRIAQAV